MLTIDELRRRIAALPRLPLCHLPTPLDELPRFSEAIGGKIRVFMKRDDLTGIGGGGNKSRKLEFSLGEAKATGCDVVVHGLAGQSNYCRQAAGAAAKVGLPCVLILRKDHKAEDPAQANRLLDYLFGAEVHMVAPEEQDATRDRIVTRLKAEGRKPYVIGKHDEILGAVGYSLCMAEIIEQTAAAGVRADFICVTGRSGTQGGLVLGKRLLGFQGEVLGFHPAPLETDRESQEHTARIVNQAAALLGFDETFTADEIHNTAAYAVKYGHPTPECLEMVHLVGRTEGLVAGPVYVGKGLAGMVDFIRTGRIPAGSTVVFVHTGGVQETYAYNAELMAALPGRKT